MPYLIASLLAVVAALVLIMSRYEADDSLFMSEIDKLGTMFSMVDGYVNTYTNSGRQLRSINFEEMDRLGVLPGNAEVIGSGNNSTLKLNGSDVTWQIIPRVVPRNLLILNLGTTNDNSSYVLLVNFSNNSSLMSKPIFTESFASREFCENRLFGNYDLEKNSYSGNNTKGEFINNGTATNNDGFVECVVYK